MSILLLVPVVGGALGGLYFVVPFWVKKLLASRLSRRVAASGVACLTFDDGPDPRSTPQLLDLLDRAGVKATFFALGCQVSAHPELARRIVESGHELGEHGFGHRHAWKTDPARYLADLVRGRRAVARCLPAGGHALFRPAYGEINLLTLLYIGLGRRRMIMWNLNPRDFEATSAEEVAQRIGRELRVGSVVLLHDARHGVEADPKLTVEAVRLVLAEADRRGLRLAAVGAALSGP
ncbi:MAG TPA: polysaccharide deacetylase family protein [Geminicoccaceae bacterium]|nr:polysaccharide deacetylase family protein [Geminicoccaceae bacterium]